MLSQVTHAYRLLFVIFNALLVIAFYCKHASCVADDLVDNASFVFVLKADTLRSSQLMRDICGDADPVDYLVASIIATKPESSDCTPAFCDRVGAVTRYVLANATRLTLSAEVLHGLPKRLCAELRGEYERLEFVRLLLPLLPDAAQGPALAVEFHKDCLLMPATDYASTDCLLCDSSRISFFTPGLFGEGTDFHLLGGKETDPGRLFEKRQRNRQLVQDLIKRFQSDAASHVKTRLQTDLQDMVAGANVIACGTLPLKFICGLVVDSADFGERDTAALRITEDERAVLIQAEIKMDSPAAASRIEGVCAKLLRDIANRADVASVPPELRRAVRGADIERREARVMLTVMLQRSDLVTLVHNLLTKENCRQLWPEAHSEKPGNHTK